MSYTTGAELDLSTHPTAQKLLARCRDFFAEVENLTPGSALEARLNADYGPGSAIFEDLSAWIRQGVAGDEGWVATTELEGARYRRSKLGLPSAANRYFSITTVYMDSGADATFRGQYHQHPYGEINCVIPIDATAQIMGMQGWQGAGWTSPGPGTHHYPQVQGGALVSLVSWLPHFPPCLWRC